MYACITSLKCDIEEQDYNQSEWTVLCRLGFIQCPLESDIQARVFYCYMTKIYNKNHHRGADDKGLWFILPKECTMPFGFAYPARIWNLKMIGLDDRVEQIPPPLLHMFLRWRGCKRTGHRGCIRTYCLRRLTIVHSWANHGRGIGV